MERFALDNPCWGWKTTWTTFTTCNNLHASRVKRKLARVTHKVSCARQSVGRRNRTYQRRAIRWTLQGWQATICGAGHRTGRQRGWEWSIGRKCKQACPQQANPARTSCLRALAEWPSWEKIVSGRLLSWWCRRYTSRYWDPWREWPSVGRPGSSGRLPRPRYGGQAGWWLKPHTLGCRQSLPKPLQPSNPVLSPEVHTMWPDSNRDLWRIDPQEREPAKRHRRILCLNLRKCYLHSMCWAMWAPKEWSGSISCCIRQRLPHL